MFSRYSLMFKIMGFSIALATVIFLIAAVGFFSNKIVSEKYNHVTTVNFKKTMALVTMRFTALDYLRVLLRIEMADTADHQDSLKTQRDSALANYEKGKADYMALPTDAKETELMKIVDKKWEHFLHDYKQMETLAFSKDPADHVKFREEMFKTFGSQRKGHSEAINTLIDYQDKDSTAWVNDSSSSAKLANTITISIMVAGVLFAILAGWYFSSSLSRTLSRATESVEKTTQDVYTASGELDNSSSQLSSGVTQAASALQETVASLEELSSMVKMNAQNSGEAANHSRASQASAEKGQAEIKALLGAMTELDRSSKKIEEITILIDDIAFQTNILSLNAAVEAARAGEQGKGFAVVAEAVRNLAQKSGAAAKDIADLIKDSVEKTRRGSEIASRSETALNEILLSVNKIVTLNSEIASASSEQATGIAQISQAMNQLDQATQSNANSAHNVKGLADQMTQQSNCLSDLVHELTTAIRGQGASQQQVKMSQEPSSVYPESGKSMAA